MLENPAGETYAISFLYGICFAKLLPLDWFSPKSLPIRAGPLREF